MKMEKILRESGARRADEATDETGPRGKCPICGPPGDYHHNADTNGYQWCGACGWSLRADGTETIPEPCLHCGEMSNYDLDYFGSSEERGTSAEGSSCPKCCASNQSYVAYRGEITLDATHAPGDEHLGHVPDDWYERESSRVLADLPAGESVHLRVAGDKLLVVRATSFHTETYEAVVTNQSSAERPTD